MGIVAILIYRTMTICTYSQTSIIRSARDCRIFFELLVVQFPKSVVFDYVQIFFLFNIVEVMGTST